MSETTAPLSKPRRITPLFRWYDFWIGAYYDRERCDLYILPLPMIGVRVHLSRCLFRQHAWSGWLENLGRYAVGTRYRFCERCGAIETGE